MDIQKYERGREIKFELAQLYTHLEDLKSCREVRDTFEANESNLSDTKAKSKSDYEDDEELELLKDSEYSSRIQKKSTKKLGSAPILSDPLGRDMEELSMQETMLYFHTHTKYSSIPKKVNLFTKFLPFPSFKDFMEFYTVKVQQKINQLEEEFQKL
jgi:hypothetical protein